MVYTIVWRLMKSWGPIVLYLIEGIIVSGIDFRVALKWWQFKSVHILIDYFPSLAKTDLKKVLELYLWARGHLKISKTEYNLQFWSYRTVWWVKIGVLEDVKHIYIDYCQMTGMCTSCVYLCQHIFRSCWLICHSNTTRNFWLI